MAFFNTDLYGIEDALYRSVCSRRVLQARSFAKEKTQKNSETK